MIHRLRKRNRRGFTLIEILIVVVIVGILAGISIPKFVDFRDDAQESAVRKDLQSLRSQINYYYFQENIYPNDLDAMVTDGYLPSYPEHPGGGNWVYNNTTGELLSSVDATW